MFSPALPVPGPPRHTREKEENGVIVTNDQPLVAVDCNTFFGVRPDGANPFSRRKH